MSIQISFPFSLIKNHGFTRQEADSCGEKGSELLCFSFFPLSLSEPKHGTIREGRLTTPKFQCFNNTHRFILHSFSVDMSRGWRWRGLCSIQFIQRPRLPIKWLCQLPGPWSPALDYLHSADEGGEHGAVAWMFYTPGLNMVDLISEHTVHWAQLVIRHHLSAKGAGKCGLPVLRWKVKQDLWIPSIVSAIHRFSKSLLSNTVTSKVCMVPVCAFV